MNDPSDLGQLYAVDGWDSYGAKAVTAEAVFAADRGRFAPTVNGGIVMEWSLNEWDITVEFGPDGDFVGCNAERV